MRKSKLWISLILIVFCLESAAATPKQYSSEASDLYLKRLSRVLGTGCAAMILTMTAIMGNTIYTHIQGEKAIARARLESPAFDKTLKFEESFPLIPIPFRGLTKFHRMNRKLWTPTDLIGDFEKNHLPEEEAIMVVVKTEFCSGNSYRACAITTSVLETQPINSLKKYRIYMAWIKNDEALSDYPEMSEAEKKDWDKEIESTYQFEQGPGATIALVSPDRTHPQILITNAAKQNLTRSSVGNDRFQTLDKTLLSFLEAKNKK